MVPYPTNNIISVPFLTGQTAHVFLIRQAKMQLRSSTSPVEQQRSEAVSLAVWMHLSPPSIMHGLSPISVVVHTTGWLLGPDSYGAWAPLAMVACVGYQGPSSTPFSALPLTSSTALPCSKWGESETSCSYLTSLNRKRCCAPVL